MAEFDTQRYNLLVSGVAFRWVSANVRFELYGELGEVVAWIEPAEDWDGWEARIVGDEQFEAWAPFPAEAARQLMKELVLKVPALA